MIILPAIDIKDGKCVRLIQGDKNNETVYFNDPVEVAVMWEKKGAEYLHLVDLDGAFDGQVKNHEIIKKIINKVSIPVEVGGGIRTEEAVEMYVNYGVDRIILGTSALKDLDLLKKLCSLYPDKIAVSIDAKDGFVALNGWVEKSDVDAMDFALILQNYGVNTIVYTDISKDGMLCGPNFEMLEKLNNALNINIIASGGIANIDHINRLREMDVYGAITGKAIYEGTLTLEEVYSNTPREGV